MKLNHLALSITSVLTVATTANCLRGVPKEREELYKPDENGNWRCLRNPEIVISFDKINDDYCDCPDGSDEPGTSACAGVDGIKGGFYCHNNGHIPGLLSFNRVDDGVCDYDICCDGSDEKEGVCVDKCKEIHEVFEKERKVKQDALEMGLKAREKLVEKAAIARDEQQKKIVKNEKDLEEKKKFLVARQEVLQKLIDEEGKNGDGNEIIPSSSPEEIEKIANEFDGLIESFNEISSKIQIINNEKSKFDDILSNLKANYNPNFNDPAVKDAIRLWEEVKGNTQSNDNQQLSLNTQLLSSLIKDLRNYRDESSILLKQQQSLSKAGPIFKIISLFVPSNNHLLLAEYLYQIQLYLARQGLMAYPSNDHPGSGQSTEKSESPAIRDARQIVTNIENEISDIQSSISSIMNDLSTDYGADDILRALHNVCIQNPIGEYDYEVCFFGQATQKNKGSHTNLGTYSSTIMQNDHLLMTFENGAKCWNGPIRRAQVEVYCGTTPQIITVSEPEKCEYFFKMSHPAACDPSLKIDSPIIHTDL